jgi:ribokinase
VVLNPASVLPRSLELLTGVELITPNLGEARALAGLHGTIVPPDGHPFEQAAGAARALLEAGVKRIVVTLGRHGALYLSREERLELGVYPTTQVDATGAGDAFTAAMAHGLARGLEAQACVRLASAVAALAVARLGAQPSFPTMAEVRTFMAGTTMAPARA